MSKLLESEMRDLIADMLTDQETLAVGVRNEALCERARKLLGEEVESEVPGGDLDLRKACVSALSLIEHADVACAFTEEALEGMADSMDCEVADVIEQIVIARNAYKAIKNLIPSVL